MQDKGAHFRRCDLQVHTPRDSQWKGRRPTVSERAAYGTEFVAACRSAGIQAVAITDHHDFAFVEHIRRAAAQETDLLGVPVPENERLTVFPGLELTLGVPCQALLVLDADFPGDRLVDVMRALSIEPVDEEKHALGDTTRLDHIDSLQKLCDILDLKVIIRGRYIVLPNVTDKGHGTLMRSGMANKYREMPCVGGYLDGTVEKKIGTGNRKIFAGKDKARGNKRIALFQTSDMRRADFRGLGEPSTWVKWATPTAEALRQACLAEESRISHSEPLLPSTAITRLVVSNSKFLGRVDLRLNGQYNAIIGGRGTGKSTLLGYLRWALCDQPVGDSGGGEIGDPAMRLRTLIAKTLAPYDATVEVHFEINNIPHIVKRRSESGEVLLKVGSDDFKRVREADVAALLPIHAYSQKQLSSVSVRVEELTRFVAAPIRRKLDEIDRKLEDVSGHMRENYATLERYRSLSRAAVRSRLRVASLDEQARNLRESLKGLSEDDRKTLAAKPAYDSARARIARVERHRTSIDAAITDVRAAVEVGEGLAAGPDIPGSLEGSYVATTSLLSRAIEDLREAMARAQAAFVAATSEGSAYGSSIQELRDGLDEFESDYVAVKQRSTAHEERLQELAELEAEQGRLRELLAGQEDEVASLGNPAARHRELRSEVLALTSHRSDLISVQCEELSNLSGGLIKAKLHRGLGLEDVQRKFSTLIRGSNVRSAKQDALFDALKGESDPLTTWSSVLDELESLMLIEPDGQVTSEQTPTLSRLGFAPTDQDRIRPRLSPDGWLDIALTPITDHPVFTYQNKEDEYIDFSSASAGQQATALLRVLLAHSGTPLIIDQPEEDLDSEVVQEVAAQIWESKTRRQIIFASHNANLVVNGDAELVVVCEYSSVGDQSSGEIRHEGAIDVPEVREAITRVMEGGERAFRLRQEKYGF